MIASNALAQRRVELDEVEEFLATRGRAPGPRRPPAGPRAAELVGAACEPLSSPGGPPPWCASANSATGSAILLARWGTIGACQPPQRAPRPSRSRTTTCSPTTAPACAGPTTPRASTPVRPWCSATASARDRGCGRRSCARGAGPRRLVEPPRDRRLGPARRPPAGRHRGVRRGRPVRHGPLRRRPGRARRLVDGREHHVRARGPPPRAGHGALRRRGRPGRRSRPCSARCASRTSPPGRSP